MRGCDSAGFSRGLRGRDILDALLVQGESGGWHVILPAMRHMPV